MEASRQRTDAEQALVYSQALASFLQRVLLSGKPSDEGIFIRTDEIESVAELDEVRNTEAEATLRTILGRHYRHQQWFPQADEHFQRRLDILRELPGDDNTPLLDALYDLAQMEITRADPAAARAYVDEAIALRTLTYGETHWSVAPVDDRLPGLLLGTIMDPQEYERTRSAFRELRYPRVIAPELDPLPPSSQVLVPVLRDDFDDGVLDPDWSVSLGYAEGWTYEERASALIVNGIRSSEELTTRTRPATVTLARVIPALGDFRARLDLGWDSNDEYPAMQTVHFRLADGRGVTVVEAFYYDGWVQWSGERRANIGGHLVRSESDSLPLRGEASIEIQRVGGRAIISWDGIPMAAGDCANPAERAQIIFTYYPYGHARGWEGSTFGSLWVEDIRIEGMPILRSGNAE
jgi:hypothetical protein